LSDHSRFGERDVKLISWYIVEIVDVGDVRIQEMRSKEDKKFETVLFAFDEILQALTFQLDRDLVRKALEIVTHTFQE
jgi:hypothetical protein